jgi:ribonuclease Y
MEFFDIWLALYGVLGAILGVGFGWLFFRWSRNFKIKSAQIEAASLLDEAQEFLELRLLEEKELQQEIELELWTKSETEVLKLEEQIDELSDLVEEKKKKNDLILQLEHKKSSEYQGEITRQEGLLKTAQTSHSEALATLKNLNNDLCVKLSERCTFPISEAKMQIIQDIENERRLWSQNWIDHQVAEATEYAESRAKEILDSALNRFMRAYCPERGIGAVHFPDTNIRKLFCNPQLDNFKAIQESCGCDIIVEDHMDWVGVAGYDPVRRELTRRTLEKVFKEKKNINPEFIRRTAEAQKKELFRQIRQDGDNLARELKLDNLHPEIRQMMGSLRYRYSFTQNQHFHCGEVGWLCGLLAADMNLDIKKARRSGMLHDIGKSMDHVLDGGHAVIGADFIAARGEAADIVHNVRAHHYDEQPAADTAFLVIAADAISGARPGARRSTLESYNQKVTELQDIARGFDGVTDCIVLNGGRECRVMVNGRRVDDSGTLALSHNIARKIEEECNYPGQIKIVVVREIAHSETTLSKGYGN